MHVVDSSSGRCHSPNTVRGRLLVWWPRQMCRHTPDSSMLSLPRARASCIRTNCFTPTYLQVGVVGTQGELIWRRCPASGGLLLVEGFRGTLQCPIPAEFCRYASVTSVLMVPSSQSDPRHRCVMCASVLCSLEEVTGVRFADRSNSTWPVDVSVFVFGACGLACVGRLGGHHHPTCHGCRTRVQA